MVPTIRDYEEESVITPEIWFATFGMNDRLNEMKDMNKYIIAFPT